MAETKAEKPKTRPKSNGATKRYMIRCSVADLALWEARARELGYASAGAWMQRVANNALREPGA